MFFKISKLADFLEQHADCPHQSRYHKETYLAHCYLVAHKMEEEHARGRVSEEALIAAYLHDIGKPRTLSIKENGETCFYGHEEVTDEEVANFLDPSYPGFDKVVALIRSHMVPLFTGRSTPEPWRSRNQQKLETLRAQWGDDFIEDLNILSRCDQDSSIPDEGEVAAAEAVAGRIHSFIKCFKNTPE